MAARSVADVLIIGAGASGAIVANELAARGFDVVCLEQGTWISPSEYPSDKLERDLLSEGPWNDDPNVRRRPEDYPCEVSASDLHPLMFNAVGGSTIHYSAEWSRLMPSDFRLASIAGVADDWPISYEELLPFYDRVDAIMGVSGTAGDPAYPPSKQLPTPGLPIGDIGRKGAEGMNRLGWHWWPSAHGIASVEYRHQGACTRRGTCSTGCPEGAKASVDGVVWPDAIAAGARVVTGARVRRVLTDGRGLATGAEWVDRDGAEHVQNASVVIMAANGVGTARLLLLSQSDRFPDGLANSSGLVGRRLMMQACGGVLGIYDEPLRSWLGPAGRPLYSAQFAETDPERGFLERAQWSLGATGGPFAVLGGLGNLPASERSGARLHEQIARAFGRSFRWFPSVEDFPNPANTVTIDPELVDADGIPAPKITYRISDSAKLAVSWNLERAREAHEAAGAIETIFTEHPVVEAGWHLLGTARMGDDPATSVVDRFGRSHDVANLFIVDGSVFVTSGASNPTATIQALALRTADHIAATARNQPLPT